MQPFNLPNEIVLKILENLNTKSLLRVSECSIVLFQLANTNKLWNMLFYTALMASPESRKLPEGSPFFKTKKDFIAIQTSKNLPFCGIH